MNQDREFRAFYDIFVLLYGEKMIPMDDPRWDVIQKMWRMYKNAKYEQQHKKQSTQAAHS